MSLLKLYEYHVADNKYIGHCILNNPRKINILTPELVNELLEALLSWEQRQDIAFVLLSGAGEKGFCAGGDIKFMYNQAKESQYDDVNYFFDKEYQLDLLIHEYSKPMIGWGHGIVMGGGMGLLQGCDIRVIESSTVMAMPESHIGLFPDVGAGYFLRKMPNVLGKFTLLTAMEINDGDAIYSGLADVCVTKNKLTKFIDECQQLDVFSIEKNQLISSINKIVSNFKVNPTNNSIFHKQVNKIIDSLQDKNIIEFERFIEKEKLNDDFWDYIYDRYFYGSPFTHAVIWQQWQHYESLTIKDALNKDKVMAKNIIRTDDFLEGVRALVVDKDKNPDWEFKKIQDVEWGKVSSMFI